MIDVRESWVICKRQWSVTMHVKNDLHEAVVSNDLEAVRSVLARQDIDQYVNATAAFQNQGLTSDWRKQFGNTLDYDLIFTPLMIAVWKKNVTIAQLLLSDSRVDPNRGVSFTWSDISRTFRCTEYHGCKYNALYIATRFHSTSVLKLLLEDDRVVDSDDNRLYNPEREEHSAFIWALEQVEESYDYRPLGPPQKTALQFLNCVRADRLFRVTVDCQKGDLFDALETYLWDPLCDEAKFQGVRTALARQDIDVNEIRHTQSIKTKISNIGHKRHPQFDVPKVWTPLIMAARYDKKDVAELLLSDDRVKPYADVMDVDDYCYSALDIAAEYNSTSVLKVLLAGASEVDVVDAFYRACLKGSHRSVQLLLECPKLVFDFEGEDRDKKNPNGPFLCELIRKCVVDWTRYNSPDEVDPRYKWSYREVIELLLGDGRARLCKRRWDRGQHDHVLHAAAGYEYDAEYHEGGPRDPESQRQHNITGSKNSRESDVLAMLLKWQRIDVNMHEWRLREVPFTAAIPPPAVLARWERGLSAASDSTLDAATRAQAAGWERGGDASGDTALCIAAREGMHRNVRTLLEHGADAHLVGKCRKRPLLIAALGDWRWYSRKRRGLEMVRIPPGKTEGHSNVRDNFVPKCYAFR